MFVVAALLCSSSVLVWSSVDCVSVRLFVSSSFFALAPSRLFCSSAFFAVSCSAPCVASRYLAFETPQPAVSAAARIMAAPACAAFHFAFIVAPSYMGWEHVDPRSIRSRGILGPMSKTANNARAPTGQRCAAAPLAVFLCLDPQRAGPAFDRAGRPLIALL